MSRYAPKKGWDRFRPAWRVCSRARRLSSTPAGHLDSMTTDGCRVARAAGCLKTAFVVAVAMNLAEALRDPGGVVWTAARAAASALFAVALVAYAVLRVLRWRHTRSDRP